MVDITLPLVAIIILNWNSKEDTIECIDSVLCIDYLDFFIILVDNASTDGSLKEFTARYHNNSRIVMISNKDNMGFSGGNNKAIIYAIDNNAAYILLLNNDTIVEPCFLTHLIKTAEADSMIGIVGPKIYYYKEKVLYFAGGKLIKSLGQPLHIGLMKLDKKGYNIEQETDFITGCCLLIKTEVIKKIGLLDEEFFAYFEDIDWNIKTRDSGYKIVYNPKAVIDHKGSGATRRYSPLYYYYITRNRILFVRKHTNVLSFIFLFLPYFFLYRYLYPIITLYLSGKNGHISSINKGILWNVKDMIQSSSLCKGKNIDIPF